MKMNNCSNGVQGQRHGTSTISLSGLKKLSRRSFLMLAGVGVSAWGASGLLSGCISGSLPGSSLCSLYPHIDVTERPYSAKGDGDTDDGQAFQRAIADAIALGLPLYVPAGVYYIDLSVSGRISILAGGPGIDIVSAQGTPGDLTMCGDGQEATKIIFGPANVGSNASGFVAWGATNVSYRGIHFHSIIDESKYIVAMICHYGPEGPAGNGFLQLRDCRTEGASVAIKANSKPSTTGDVVVSCEDCHIQATEQGILMRTDEDKVTDVQACHLTDCIFETESPSGTYPSPAHNVYLGNNTSLRAQDCAFRKLPPHSDGTPKHSVIFNGGNENYPAKYVEIIRCTFTAEGGGILTNRLTKSQISQCTFILPTRAPGVKVGPAGAKIANCDFRNSSPDDAMDYAIVDQSGAPPVQSTLVSGCTFDGPTLQAFIRKYHSSSVEWRFTNCTFKNHSNLVTSANAIVLLVASDVSETNIFFVHCTFDSVREGVPLIYLHGGSNLALEACSAKGPKGIRIDGTAGSVNVVLDDNTLETINPNEPPLFIYHHPSWPGTIMVSGENNQFLSAGADFGPQTYGSVAGTLVPPDREAGANWPVAAAETIILSPNYNLFTVSGGDTIRQIEVMGKDDTAKTLFYGPFRLINPSDPLTFEAGGNINPMDLGPGPFPPGQVVAVHYDSANGYWVV